MSIKSDRWIRRMAEEHGMIDPFEPGQAAELAMCRDGWTDEGRPFTFTSLLL